jgi:hypothetical protein
MVGNTETVKLPKSIVEELYQASLTFNEVIETLEVLLDKPTVRRLRLGEKEYRQGKYVAAKTRGEIEKVILD